MVTDEIRKASEKLSGKTEGLSFRAETVSYGVMRSVLEKNCSLFFEGLEECSTEKTTAALREISKRIGDTKDSEFYESREEAFIGKLSSVERRLESIRKDGSLDLNLCRGHLHPFLGTADEMYETIKYSFRDCDYYKPITSLTLGVSYFLWNFRDNYPETIREKAYPYVCKWLMRYVEILSEDFDVLMDDDDERYARNDDPDGPEGAWMFLTEMVRDPVFSEVLDYVFELLGDKTAAIEKRCCRSDSPLNTAVLTGNMKAFDRFVSYPDILDIIRIPRGKLDLNEHERYWPGYNTGKICVYPEESTEMLERLWSMNILIPGTEEAKDAFFLTLRECSPSRETLSRIKHPSYFKADYEAESSPLRTAYFNEDFPVENYDLLVESEGDINGRDIYGYDLGTPLIADAVKSGDREKVEVLVKLGADISWHDRWGNNILHRLYADEAEDRKHWNCTESDLDKEAEALPQLRAEKNAFGRLPSDYSASLPSSFGTLRSITLTSALDRVFLPQDGRRTDCVFYGKYLEDVRPWNFIHLIEDYFEFRRKDLLVVTPKNYEELEAVLKKSEEGKDEYAVLIPWLYSLRKDGKYVEPFRVIGELLRRENVSVMLLLESAHEKLLEDITAPGDVNLFVSKTQNELISDILLSRSGASSLEKGRFILRTKDGWWSIDSVPHDIKASKRISKKGRIWYSL